MKFSVIFEAQLADPAVEREHQVVRDCVEQAVFAERMGFDRIRAVEHHSLKWFAHMGAPGKFSLRIRSTRRAPPLQAQGRRSVSLLGRLVQHPQGIVKGASQALDHEDGGRTVERPRRPLTAPRRRTWPR
ncbi:hypothetical protein ACFY15_17990 [Streptomyces sp. NPDC001373]|uniref:hypothetical protein n=1 Tax=Streptomyces sp. NPDC001373 TaxID=3364565 RepID=UPI0036C793B9